MRDRSPRFVAAFALGIFMMALLAAQSISPVARDRAASDQTASTSERPLEASDALAVKFARAVTYGSGGFYASSVAVADLNGDGRPDIVVANSCEAAGGQSDCSAGGTVGVLIANADGTVQPYVSYDSGGIAASSVAIADVNGDGRLDLVVANQCVSTADCSNGVVGVLLGNGDGTFQPTVTYVAGYGADALAVADLNGDGHPDLVVANQCTGAGSCNTGGVSVLLGNGNGTFQPPATYNSGGQDADSVAIKDVNHDGFLDVIVANQCMSKFNCKTGGISVLLGNGDGTLRTASSYSSDGYTSLSVAVADVNGDGEPDIVASNLCSQSTNCVAGVVGVLLNNGNGTFQPVATYSSSGYGASSVAIGDVNGDGIPDLVVDSICKTSASCNVGGVSLLLGVGDGTFQTPIVYSSAGNNASSVTLADLNSDSRPDIVTANSCSTKSNCNGGVAILSNITSIKTTTSIASSINPSVLNQQVIFTATMTSSPSIPNGEVVMFYHGATLLGTGTITNNVATLTTSFAKATNYTIKATYAGDAFHKKSSGTVKQVVNE
jgi:hypothetical protein